MAEHGLWGSAAQVQTPTLLCHLLAMGTGASRARGSASPSVGMKHRGPSCKAAVHVAHHVTDSTKWKHAATA